MGSDLQAIEQARQLLQDASVAVGFTGAGVSTASGIPDFRGPGGLWTRFDPEEFTYERFQRDPAGFWEKRSKLTRALNLDEVEPNPCHRAMAQAVEADRLGTVITQNIDGLHQAAGVPDDKVLEIHGSTRQARCVGCGDREPIDTVVDRAEDGQLPPNCQSCGDVLKPDVVLFGEVLPQTVFQEAQRWADRADVMLVAGSSLQVYPAAGLPQRTLAGGGKVVIVNGDRTPLDGQAHVVVRGRVEKAVPRILG